MINFVCVLKKLDETNKKKNLYNAEWVYRLQRGIERNYKKPYKFLCLSNIELEVESVPLITNWPGWWSKIELFRRELFEKPVVYLDLDVVICKNFETLIDNIDFKKFNMLKEPSGIPNSSMMAWQGDYSSLFCECRDSGLEEIERRYRQSHFFSDQEFISQKLKINFLNNNLNEKEFAWYDGTTKYLSTDPFFLIFIGKHNKPNKNLAMDLVKNNWI